MAFGASYREVPASQNKAGLLVLGQAKGRRLVSLQIVALVAGIEIGRSGKLVGVTVGMAIGATTKLDLIQGVFALGDVALHAFQPRVSALKGVFGRSVILHSE